MNIFVGNMSYQATEEELRSTFAEFGQIQSATIIKDKATGESKGFGFVEMHSNKEAQSAIEGLNNKEFMGRSIMVNEARPREDRRRGSGGYGSGGHGGYRDTKKRRRY